MKRFNFRLEKVLKLRAMKEEECRIELGKAISILNQIEDEIKKTALKRHHAASMRFGNAAEMVSWNVYILRLDREAQILTEKAAQAELIVEEKREQYLEASRDLKALEKLKEKREKEHYKEMAAIEMLELDDQTAARIAVSSA